MSFFTKMKSGSKALETAKMLQDESQRAQAEIDRLKRKVESLSLICQAMWRLIGPRLELEDDMLRRQVQELEACYREDIPPSACISCQRPIHVRKKKCVFCGATQPDRDIFEQTLMGE